MSKMTLTEALEASVDALFRPNHRFLQLLPILKHVERFIGRAMLLIIPIFLLSFFCEWSVIRFIVVILGAVLWGFAIWLMRNKRRYEKQVEQIAFACSESTGIDFKDDVQFRELVNMYYVDLKVKELLDGDR